MAPSSGIGNWFDRRQVAFGYLLELGRPCSVTEVRDALRQAQFEVTNKQVSDLLRQQVHRGRVARVRRGVYVAVAASVSRSTRQRAIRAAVRRGALA